MSLRKKMSYLIIVSLVAALALAGCGDSGAGSVSEPVLDTTAPAVSSTAPFDGIAGVAINSTITASFSEEMDPATIIAANFTVAAGATPVSGTVTYSVANATARFTPDADLDTETTYTATVSTGVMDSSQNAMEADKVWTFTTASATPATVDLGTAGDYVILAKTGISTVPDSAITGNIGVSPAAETYITGFSQTDYTSYATSDQVTGMIYAADMASPTPLNLTTAVSDMESAYDDAAGRVDPTYRDLGAGEIGKLTLTPGLYKWTTDLGIVTGDVTISGTEDDVWIFQIPGNLTLAGGRRVNLIGGAQAQNIFWQVAGEVAIGTYAQFEGVVLSKTAITFGTSASMNGRAMAQSAVALDQNTILEPTE